MPTFGAIALLVVLAAATFPLALDRRDGVPIAHTPPTDARSKSDMRDEVADELRRLRHNQTVLMAAINRLITETAPITTATPADGLSGNVTTGLVLNAEGLIVPGKIPAPDPRFTLRGLKPGDPLWVDPPVTP